MSSGGADISRGVCVKFLRRIGNTRCVPMAERTVPPYEGGTTGGSPLRQARPPLSPLLPKEGKPAPLALCKNLTHTLSRADIRVF